MFTIAEAHGPITQGAVIGTAIVTLIVGVCLLVFIAGMRRRLKSYNLYAQREGVMMAGTAAVVAGLSVLIYVAAMWPFAYNYHHYIDTKGVVASVNRRIVGDGDGGVNEKFVVRFQDGRIRAVEDTAAATLRAGDPISLRCKKAYDYGTPRSAQGWDCKWNQVRR